MDVSAVILAAGASRRFGSPKQLAVAGGETLLRRAVAAARASRCGRIVVVLGSDAPAVRRSLGDLPVDTVLNPDWREGMASSIRTAVSAVLGDDPPPDAVILMTCDQPRVDGSVLDRLGEAARRSGSGLAACEYAGGPGIPALFSREHFPALLALKGDRGAMAVLLAHADRIARVPWPDGAVDVDVPGDLDGCLGE